MTQVSSESVCLACQRPLRQARKFLGEHTMDWICPGCAGFVVEQKDGSADYYSPLPHQAEFHQSEAPNFLMEGGRGTGKSDAIRFDAHMRALRWPGFTYLVLRRTVPELRKSHLHFIDYEMKKLGGYFNKSEGIAYYPNGSRGYYSHCETEGDILNFLSSQFGAIYFDELTTFSLTMFLQISSSARAPEAAGYVAVVRGGTNPIGEGSGWVRTWFIDKTVNLADYPDYHPEDFGSNRSTYRQNPHINQAAYRGRLSSLPGHIRAGWLEGEWRDAFGYFEDWCPVKYDDETGVATPWHVIDELPTMKGRPLLDQRWVSVYRVLDWGFHPDPAVCLWIAVLPNGRGIVFRERSWLRTTAADVAQDMATDSKGMKVVDTLCDPTMFLASRATDGQSIGDIFELNGIPLTPSLNDREAAGLAIHERLNTVIDGVPQIQVWRSACPNLLRTLPQMRCDPNNPRKIANGEDHWVIALSYFCQTWISPSREPQTVEIPRWMQPAKRTVIGAGNVRVS